MAMIGIDLGTTNSLVSYWDGEKSVLIENSFSEVLTPSIVSLGDDNEIFVGDIAKQRLITHPDRTVANFKRKMGSKATFELGNQKFNPEELSALVLKQLKQDAENTLNTKIDSAVISVPAYFNEAQRKSTKIAGELAGLKIERLINEPTAAAIAYGIHEKYKESNIIVIDLGGGTFDVSVLEFFEGVMEVHSTAGDNFLGGEDFTNALIVEFLKSNDLKGTSLNKKDQARLTRAINKVKISLSYKESIELSHRIGEKEYNWQCSRLDLERICQKLLLKLRNPIERSIRDSNLNLCDLNEVILVGGATKMPLIKTLIAKMFRRLPSSNINPDEVVALGCAVQSALIQKNEALSDVVLTDVCPYTLGVEISVESQNGGFEEGHFLPMIERNSTIPVSRMDNLVTIANKQKSILCKVFQGESRLTKNNIFLGQLDVKVPKGDAGSENIELRFTYNVDGMLEVQVTVCSTNEVSKLVIKNSESDLSDKEIEQSFKTLEGIKVHPRKNDLNKLILSRAERIYEESLGDKRQYIANLIANFEAVLDGQEIKDIENARVEISNILDDLDESIF